MKIFTTKILTWKSTYNRPAPCPDYKPDPYTGQYPMTHCLVYHLETVTEDRTKEFLTVKEAKEFAKKAPESCFDFMLNGKPIKDTRNFSTGTITALGSLLDISGTSGTTTITPTSIVSV